MSLQLAGFADERDGAVADGVAGEPTLRGNRLAEQHGIAVAGFDPNTPIAARRPRHAGSPGDVAPPSTPKPAVDAKPARDTQPGGAA